MSDLFKYSSQEMENLIQKFGKKTFKLSNYQNVNSVISNILIMGYFSYKVITKNINLGSYVALINAAQQLTEQTKSLFSIFPQFYEHSIYIDNFIEFMEYECQIKENTKANRTPPYPDIILKKVYFTYPNSEKAVLNNINMTIPYGKKLHLLV